MRSRLERFLEASLRFPPRGFCSRQYFTDRALWGRQTTRWIVPWLPGAYRRIGNPEDNEQRQNGRRPDGEEGRNLRDFRSTTSSVHIAEAIHYGHAARGAPHGRHHKARSNHHPVNWAEWYWKSIARCRSPFPLREMSFQRARTRKWPTKNPIGSVWPVRHPRGPASRNIAD